MEALQRDDRATVTVGPREVQQAREVDALLAGGKGAVTVDLGADRHHTLPPELAELVLTLVELVGRGSTVTVGSIPTEITTTVAASMLRMSRPSLLKLVRAERSGASPTDVRRRPRIGLLTMGRMGDGPFQRVLVDAVHGRIDIVVASDPSGFAFAGLDDLQATDLRRVLGPETQRYGVCPGRRERP